MCYSVSSTASHRYFKVVAGLDALSAPGQHSQSRSVHRLRVHESFSAATLDNDVALVRLASPWTFDAHVQPACTPHNVTHELGLNLSLCFVTGWGSVSYNGGWCEDLTVGGVRPTSLRPQSSTCDAHVQCFL